MTQIIVKDSEWYRDAYDMPNKVKVYVGMTRKDFERMTKEEVQKRNYDFYMGQAGFDDEQEATDVA